MRIRIGLLLPAIACCLLFAAQAQATDYAYGYTSIYVDSGNEVRGYHRTELDYNSDLYYTPYVCGQLSKDGVQVVRACQGGYHSATRYTNWPYFAGSSYSALSDHYVDMAYQEEDPNNPGYYSFADFFGYGFAGSGGHPIDWYWVATAVSNLRQEQSIHLGDTNAQVRTPTKLVRFDYTAHSPGAPDGYGPLLLTTNTNNEVRNVKNEAIETNKCGVYRNLVYELLDQNGDAISGAYSITEKFSAYSHSTSYTSGTVPADFETSISAGGLVQDLMFLGKTSPTCLGSDDNESFDQSFVVTISGRQYTLSTINHVSRGRFAGTYKVDVTITTP